jgi:hypothetical protein
MDRLYLETSTLQAAKWPGISASLQKLCQLANRVGIEVFIPGPVEHELAAHWVRAVGEKDRALTKAHKELERLLGGDDLKSPEPLSLRSHLRRYRQRVAESKHKLGLVSCPQSADTTRAFFRLATAHRPPFKKEGQGFQDAVVYFSVLDHLAKFPCSEAGLITSDSDFDEPILRDLEKKRRLDLTLFSSFDDAYGAIMKGATDTFMALLEADEEAARQAFARDADRLTEFLRENLVMHESDFSLFPRRFKRVKDVSVKAVTRVRTAFTTVIGEPITVPITAHVALIVTVEATGSRSEPPRRVLVGKDVPREPLTLDTMLSTLHGPLEELQVEREAIVEATAFRKDRAYSDIVFRSAALASDNPFGFSLEG